MNYFGYVGFVVFSLVVAYGVRWLDPAFLSQLARRTGLSKRKGWTIATVAVTWIWLPVLAGAETGDGKSWVFGTAISGVGFFLATIAVTSVDEYRLLRRVPRYEPRDVSVDVDEPLVATSGIPTPLDGDEGAGEQRQAETPFSGIPAVYVNWFVQERRRVGARTIWRNVAGGVRATKFAVGGGALEVTPGRHRVFTNAENRLVIEPDDDVPERAATFLEEHPDLPAANVRENPLRVIETYVPLGEPVTVIGTAEQTREPGVVRLDDGPVDELLGTHADHSSSGGGAEVVLIQGDAEAAGRAMKKRVVWLGTAGVAMIGGGQLVAFWLSAASATALLV